MFEKEHKAFDWGIALGRGIAWVKIWGLSALMRTVGKTREATLLQNAYTAFSVYNTPRYDRSILSAVDNAIALRVSAWARDFGRQPCMSVLASGCSGCSYHLTNL